MGIINRERALYMATGIDNTGLYSGHREAMGIIKAMASQITSFDVFSGIGLSAATAFASAAKDSYNFEKDFRKNMLEVATISTQVSGSMTDFMNRVVSITQQIPVSAPEAAKALYQIVSAGHDGADGMKVLEVSARSAVGGLTDTATAADAITSILNSYKLSADKAEQVSDQLFTTVRLGKTTFGELGHSISQVTPVAAAYGVSIDEVLAAIASLTKSGTPTAQAVTQVRASIIAASKVLGDGAFEGRTFQETLELIAKRANGSETALRGMITEVEAQVGILALTGRNAQSAASDLNELQNSAGATEAAFRKMKDEVGNQLTLLTNNINAILRPMGTTLLKNVSAAAQAVNDGFETGKIEDSLGTLKKLLVAVAGTFLTYKAAVNMSAAAQAYESAKTTVLNNLKSIQNKITGEAIIAKEKERIYQEAYIATLEKTITEEERAKLAKLNLKSSSAEYSKTLSELALQEKKNAESLVDSLAKSIAKNKERLSVAQENLDASHLAVEAAKKEFEAAFAANDLAGVEAAQTKLNAAAKREEAAANNVATISQKVNGQQKQLAVATTQAETAATRINTAITKADATTKGIATTATNKLKLASAGLWATMKANPVGAVLTLVSLAITTYMLLADKIKKVETAQDRLNKINRQAADSIASEQAELKLLLGIAKNELVSKEDRLKAIKRLNEVSPEYLGNLSLENINTEAATSSLEKYSEALMRNAKIKAAQEMVANRAQRQNEIDLEVQELQKLYDKTPSGSESKHLYESKIVKLKQEKVVLQKEIDDVLSFAQKDFEQTPIKIPVNIQLESEQANISALIRKKEEIENRINGNKEKGLFNAFDEVQLQEVNKLLQESLDKSEALRETSNKRKEEDSTVLQRKIKLTKELSEAEGSLKKLRAPESKASDQEIEAAQKKVDETKAKLKALTGLSAKEGTDLLKSQTELSRSILDSDLKLQEMRLSIMEDGRQKRLKQSELEYKQQKAAIDKEYQDTVQKYKEQGKAVPNSVKTLYESRLGANNETKVARDNKINEDYLKERRERETALTAYLLTEESKRKKAIKERYDAEREWAKKQFQGENMTDTEYTNYLGRINTAEAAEGLQELLDKYQDYTAQRKDIERNFDEEIATLERSRTDRNAAEVDRAIAEAQKKRKEALSGIDLSEFQDSIDWSSVFGDLDAQTTQSLSTLRDKLKNYINKAAKDLKPEDLKVLQDAFKDIDFKISERRPFKELGKDLEEYKAAQAGVNKAQEELNYVMAGGEIITGLYMDKTGKMVKKLLTQEEAEKNLTEAQKKRKAAMAAIGNSAAGVANEIGSASTAASKIINVLEDDFGVKVGDNIKGMVEGFNELSDGISSAVQSALKGDIAGVIAGVVQTVGGLFKSIGSIFGLGNHKGEEDLKRLEEASNRIVESQKIINSLIEKRIELINKATIAEQKNLAATTEQAIKNQKAYYEQQFKNLQGNWLLDKKGKHNNLTAADLGINSIEELADFLTGSDRLLALQKQGYSVRDLDKWMEIVNAYQGLEESKKELAETTAKNLTGITLEDAQSALDEFLKNADTTMEDVAGSFENYMQDAMLGIVKQNTLNKALEDWYNHFEQAMDSGEGLDETEVKNLQQEYEDAFTTAQQSYESMLKAAGMSLESDSSGRQATEKGIASMSQDSANELNGNFSALLIYSNKTAENTSSLRESMNYILEIQRAGWGDVRAIKELTSQMRVHTEKISELSEMIESNTKKAATGIDTLNTKGIYLKK